ncbi:hypothetical protein KIW84_060798 [Lathyrus oleraceus]|uniref:Nucleoplasmin-like domain-containing protein n=1 Tax=Pisum sativum TaxID=3888 RepID=A0A9D4W0M3_PEA|nr:hypothetical protein KIW84_060798 [Pisum sativum]
MVDEFNECAVSRKKCVPKKSGVGEFPVPSRMSLSGALTLQSLAALGEFKKDKANEPVVICLKVGDQKFVLGTLNREKIPQTTLELVLDEEFELSHSSKISSAHFCGYKAYYPDNEYSDEDDFSDSDKEEIPLARTIGNGKPEIKVENQKVSEAKKAPAKSGVHAKPEPPAKSDTSAKQIVHQFNNNVKPDHVTMVAVLNRPAKIHFNPSRTNSNYNSNLSTP